MSINDHNHDVTHNDIFYKLGEIEASTRAIQSTVAANRESVAEQNVKLDSIHKALGGRLGAVENDILRAKTVLKVMAVAWAALTGFVVWISRHMNWPF